MVRLTTLVSCVALLAACALIQPPSEDSRPAPPAEEAEPADASTIEVQPLETLDTGEPEALPASDGEQDEGEAPRDESGENQEPADEQSGASNEPALEVQGDADAGGADASRYTLEGRIDLEATGEPITPDQFQDVVVYFEPEAGSKAPSPGQFEIRTHRKRFIPDLMVVPVGSTIAFPNDDDILHNVFSVSPNARFDLGRYGLGESRAHVFDEKGLALIYCDVHHAMQAEVLVLDTPYFTRADDNGSFRLGDLPPGPGTLYVWHPRANGLTKTVAVPMAGQIAAKLELVKPRVAQHTHKTGEPYRPSQQADSSKQPDQDSSKNEPQTATSSQAAGGDNVLEGRVVLTSDNESPGPDVYREIVVYYEPEAGKPRPEPGHYEIGTRNKRFMPDLLVVPVGSTIAFPNSDDILHNVFSVSPIAVFDLGRYGQGESRSHTFDEAGLALIHCNVHHAMQAEVLVVDTPYFTRAGADGSFRLTGLPDGPGTLHFWHPRTDGAEQRVSLPQAGAVGNRLAITKPRVPKHLNKFGEPYRKRRDTEDNLY